MAVGRISGQVLKAALYRDGFDIKLGNTPTDTALTYFDVNNNRLGINNESPLYTMDVTGNAHVSNSIETLEIDVGDVLINTNTIKSTAGNINLLAGSTADFITLDGNVDVTNNLVVQNDITATSGTVISNTAEIAGMNMFEDSSGDQFFTTDAGPLILQPFEGSEIQLDSAEVVIPNGRTFKIKDADGKTVFQIDGSNDGLVNSEQMQIDDVFIHDNVVEVNVEDQDFILKAGNPSSASADDPQIIMQSEVTVLRDFKVEGLDAKVIIDQELELNADTEASIEAYTGDLNLRVNNLGDSTVNTINLHGSVNSYGYFYIDHDLTVARTVETNEVITNNLNTVDSSKTIYVYDNLDVVDSVDADRLIINDILVDNNVISNELSDIVIDVITNRATSGKVQIKDDLLVDETITTPTLTSTLLIDGVDLTIDNFNMDANTLKTTAGDMNIFADSGTINFLSNLEVTGNIHATGSIVADGDLVLGDANTDNITFNADVNTDILPDIDSDGTLDSGAPWPIPAGAYGSNGTSIGALTKNWKNIYSRQFTLNEYTVNQINNDHTSYLIDPESEVPTPGADARLITEGGMVRFFFDNLAFNTGDNIQLGPPDDSTFDDGAFVRSATISQGNFDTNSDLRIEDKLDKIDENIDIAEAVDMLNEAMNNIRNNTFIRSIDFSANPTAAGSGTQVTLNLDVDGTWNRVEVDWDVSRRFDELETQIPGYNRPAESHDYMRTGANLSTVSFIYNAPLGGLFSVKVVVRNTDAQSPGSAGTDSEEVKIDYITIYTPDPVADYDLFRSLPLGTGTALSGNQYYVIEGQSLYLENFTSNTGGFFPNEATYEVDWGDGTPLEEIGELDADGFTIIQNGDPQNGGGDKLANGAGADAPRLVHTYLDGTQTGSGTTPLRLFLRAHTTADPAVIAAGVDVSYNLKIYENDPATPARINTKPISFAGTGTNGTTGTSPYLASGATIATINQTVFPGNPVNRTIKTSGTIQSTTTSSYAFSDLGLEEPYDPLNKPVVKAIFNGDTSVADGEKELTNVLGSNGGTVDTLVISAESDYNLLSTNGTTLSFANSIHYPDAFYGYRARLAKDASTVPFGLNSFRIDHDAPVAGVFSTNEIEFVKDDLTVVPSLSAGTVVAGNNGTYRYISGIPYYSTGNPSVFITGIEVSNLIGETYSNISDPLNVTSGANYEGTSSSAIPYQSYSYVDINDGSVPMIDNSNIPLAQTGVASNYVLDDIEVNLATSNARTIDTLRYFMKNVNGNSSYSNKSQPIAYHKSGQFGISEIAIQVSNSLGNGVYTDDGKRIFDFATDGSTDNPLYNSATNYYSNNLYTENSDPGVEGTQESTVRLGEIEHNVIDYTNFLPSGPDRSGDTGQQWFTFAFRRQVVANFSISISTDTGASNKGIAGMWIAIPGTAIDSASSSNGWLDCSLQYAGAGVPGGDTLNGGNGSDGCAITGADRINLNTNINGSFDMTLGAENMSNATNNLCIVRIRLDTGQRITSLSIGTA
jgi:uncharacterized protein YxjI